MGRDWKGEQETRNEEMKKWGNDNFETAATLAEQVISSELQSGFSDKR
jgi:hypothetical protein